MKRRLEINGRRLLSALLAAILLLTSLGAFAEASPLDVDAIQALNGGAARIYESDGRVTFVDGTCTDRPVPDMATAADVVEAMIPLLGGDAKAQFDPWRILTDAAGNIYYVFQQMQADTTVLGGAVKVVTDPEGNMLGLVASVESALPDAQEAEGISAETAEALVTRHMQEINQARAEIVEGRTQKVILPVEIEPDITAEDIDTSNRYVWVVYTTNPNSDLSRSSELPFLAHYVTMNCEYLYSLPTIIPGDAAGTAGFDAAYIFEFMEPADYTGTVRFSDGTEREITVSLMRDSRTGMYYLGNIKRRIVVADCYEFIYNGGRVMAEASPDNTGWDNTCLLTLYNYCRAWDYYNAIGWNGSDGMGTPMLVLKDYCNIDHAPIDNAAYAGRFYGWETFLSSGVNDFSQCLDVLAHEFTHCVTQNVMTYNAYMNDYGAINEAMSDIQGNICEMMMGATEDADWLIGECSSHGAIRSMSDPHKFGQPAFAWDLKYVPSVKSPTMINDQGGVHTNSSLLGNVAYRLCEDGGMTLEEARAFWFAVDAAMVPASDYAQLSALMPWVLRHQGMERYADALEAAMDATRLRSNDVPDTVDDDRALVMLTLPDQDNFLDGNWMMYILSVNADGFARRFREIEESEDGFGVLLEDLLTALYGEDPEWSAGKEAPKTAEELVTALLEAVAGTVFVGEDGEPSDEAEGAPDAFGDKTEVADRLKAVFQKYCGDLIYGGSGVAGQDGRTMRMVSRPGMTIPVLFRLEIDQEMHVKSAGFAIRTFGRWIDLGEVIAQAFNALSSTAGETETSAAEEDEPDWLGMLNALSEDSGDDLMGAMEKLSQIGAFLHRLTDQEWFIKQLFFRIEGGAVNEIPADGLEAVKTLYAEDYPFMEEALTSMMSEDGAIPLSVAVDYGASELYGREALSDAVNKIWEKFKDFEGCELHTLRYAGDDCASAENLLRLDETGKEYAQVVEFLSDFHSPVRGGGAWQPDREYTDWQWWLAREEGGEWELVSWGY